MTEMCTATDVATRPFFRQSWQVSTPAREPVGHEGVQMQSVRSQDSASNGKGAAAAEIRLSPAPPAGRLSERELLSRLGLDGRASSDDILSTHDDVLAFLATAPNSLRTWARVQAADADEAFVLLTDPTALAVSPALEGSSARSDSQPGGAATPPARRATLTASDPAPPEDVVPADVGAESREDIFDNLLAEVTPSTHRETLPEPRQRPPVAARAAAPSAGAERVASPRRSMLRRLALPTGIVAGALAILFAGYQLGGGPAAEVPGPSPTSGAAAPQLDEARIVALMQRIQADPSDQDALMALADAYYQVGDFGASATWLEKVVALDETNLRARLALGAARFNLGDLDAARLQWEAVLERDPANVEAHYDMGFLFLNLEPPDLAGVQRAWGEVVRLAPDSDIAATVKAHLDAIASPDPSARPVATAPSSTAPSTAPSASSPAPSGAPQP